MLSTQSVWGYDDGMERELLAIIVRGSPDSPGVNFVTPPSLPQQVAVMKRKEGEVIKAHTHPPQERVLSHTMEVLIVKSGKMMCQFYASNGQSECHEVKGGEILILMGGGHGFKFLEDTELIEVKQGPFKPEVDKVFINNESEMTAREQS